MKKCNKCLETKEYSEFGKESRAKNGYKPRCKKCSNEYYNSLYPTFREKKINQIKTYFENNKNYVQELKKTHKIDKEKKSKYNKDYRIKNREKLNKVANEYEKNKVKNNPHYRLVKNMRKLVYRTLLNKSKNTVELLGYDANDLLQKLSRYPNQTEAIDHKIPVSWFVEYADIKLINHLDNLQILSSHDNSVKNNKFAHKISIEYFELIKNIIKPKYINKINYGN